MKKVMRVEAMLGGTGRHMVGKYFSKVSLLLNLLYEMTTELTFDTNSSFVLK